MSNPSKPSKGITRRDLIKIGTTASIAGLLSNSNLADFNFVPNEASAAEAIPALKPQFPLGVSNTVKNAHDFVTKVMKLPTDTPIYGQHLTRQLSGYNAGPWADASWCGAGGLDSDTFLSTSIREISAHNHAFGRANITLSNSSLPSTSPITLDEHIAQAGTRKQTYYFYNEPEFWTYFIYTSGTPNWCYGPSVPSDRQDEVWPIYKPSSATDQVDPTATSCLSNPVMETKSDAVHTNNYWGRIRSLALAKLYLQYVYNYNMNGHRVLPPASISGSLGFYDTGSNPDGDAYLAPPPAGQTENGIQYWRSFFTSLKNGVSASCVSPSSMGIPDFPALHTHDYHIAVSSSANPLKNTAWTATAIRSGVKWLRNLYNYSSPLPMDYYLSEMGPAWKYRNYGINGPRVFAGTYESFWKGLVYFNSWLRWLSLEAPSELDLSTGKKVYGMLHVPQGAPFMTPLSTESTRPQTFFDTEIWNANSEWVLVAPSEIMDSVPPTGNPAYPDTDHHFGAMLAQSRNATTHAYAPGYTKTFTLLKNSNVGEHDGVSYQMTPLAASYIVWAHRGGNAVNTAFGSGWHYHKPTTGNTASFATGRVNVTVDAGWNTIYIPFYKKLVGLETDTSHIIYRVYWYETTQSTPVQHGSIDVGSNVMAQITHSGYVAAGHSNPPTNWEQQNNALPLKFPNATQTVYPAIVCPLLVKADVAGTFQIELRRDTGSGATTGVYIGTPFALRGYGCSWSEHQ